MPGYATFPKDGDDTVDMPGYATFPKDGEGKLLKVPIKAALGLVSGRDTGGAGRDTSWAVASGGAKADAATTPQARSSERR